MMSLWIPARELDITWINDSSYWKWTPLPHPNEEEEVAELLEVCWLNIVGKVELRNLLVKRSYCANLVFKLNESSYGLNRATGRVKFAGGARNLNGGEEVCSTTVSISEKERPGAGREGGGVRFPQSRGNGWMQIKLGEFFNDVHGQGVVEASLFETERLNWKSGLIVKGIEVLPKLAVAAAEEVVPTYLRSKLSSILNEAYADPNSPSHIMLRFQSIESYINVMFDEIGISNTPTTNIILYELIDALSDCRIFAHRCRNKPNKGFFGRVMSEFFSKKKIWKQLDSIETRLNIIIPPPPLLPSRDHARSFVIQQTYPLLDPSRIIGFESYVDNIEGLMLLEENRSRSYAIGIVGRCGCGKTALAQKVFASPRIQAEFSSRIWVCLPRMMFFDNNKYRCTTVGTRVRVLSYILNQMGYDFSEDPDCDAIELQEKLRQELMGKRYLIVLDDAWRFDEFYADLMYTGGTLIVTSRSENVIRRTVGDNNNHVNMIRMEPHLSHEICREIFDNVVREKGIIDVDHPTLEKIKDDLLRNYDGLPLAVTSLADIISELLDQNIGILPTISEEEYSD